MAWNGVLVNMIGYKYGCLVSKPSELLIIPPSFSQNVQDRGLDVQLIDIIVRKGDFREIGNGTVQNGLVLDFDKFRFFNVIKEAVY